MVSLPAARAQRGLPQTPPGRQHDPPFPSSRCHSRRQHTGGHRSASPSGMGDPGAGWVGAGRSHEGLGRSPSGLGDPGADRVGAWGTPERGARGHGTSPSGMRTRATGSADPCGVWGTCGRRRQVPSHPVSAAHPPSPALTCLRDNAEPEPEGQRANSLHLRGCGQVRAVRGGAERCGAVRSAPRPSSAPAAPQLRRRRQRAATGVGWGGVGWGEHRGRFLFLRPAGPPAALRRAPRGAGAGRAGPGRAERGGGGWGWGGAPAGPASGGGFALPHTCLGACIPLQLGVPHLSAWVPASPLQLVVPQLGAWVLHPPAAGLQGCAPWLPRVHTSTPRPACVSQAPHLRAPLCIPACNTKTPQMPTHLLPSCVRPLGAAGMRTNTLSQRHADTSHQNTLTCCLQTPPKAQPAHLHAPPQTSPSSCTRRCTCAFSSPCAHTGSPARSGVHQSPPLLPLMPVVGGSHLAPQHWHTHVSRAGVRAHDRGVGSRMVLLHVCQQRCLHTTDGDSGSSSLQTNSKRTADEGDGRALVAQQAQPWPAACAPNER